LGYARAKPNKADRRSMTFNIFDNERFSKILSKWGSDEDPLSSDEDLGKSVVNLLIDMKLEHKKIYDANETLRTSIRNELIEANKDVPRVKGSQTIGQEMIHSFLTGDYEGAIALLLSVLEERGVANTEYHSSLQRKAAKSPRNDPLNMVLSSMLDANPNLATSEAIAKLKKNYGSEVYITDESEGVYVESKKKCYPITCIKDRLSRLKKKLR
jgi:hypothetical protein